MQALCGQLGGRASSEHALTSVVVRLIVAAQQALEIAMGADGDTQDLSLDSAVEALGHSVGLWRVGFCHPVLDLELHTGTAEHFGEGGPAVGQDRGDAEREGTNDLLEESYRTPLREILLNCQVHRARTAVDGDEEIAPADLTVCGSELGQVFHVQVNEAQVVVAKPSGALA